jgi:hypothetical protein
VQTITVETTSLGVKRLILVTFFGQSLGVLVVLLAEKQVLTRFQVTIGLHDSTNLNTHL